MHFDGRLFGQSVYLRNIEMTDCNEKYHCWLNDPDVNRFLETRLSDQSIKSIIEFVASRIESNDSYLFAIVEGTTENHIGNIKIGPINRYHSFADVSYFIGAKECWGKGFATEAITLATRFGFDRLGLYKCVAGVYGSNKASIRALEKAGYQLEGRLRKKVVNYLGQREDHLYYGIENGAL